MSKTTKETPVALKVVARYAGHYGGQHIREGQAFELAARADFATSWMAPVDWDPDEGAAEPKKTSTET